MPNIITHNKRGYELIPGSLKVQLSEEGKFVEVSAEDLTTKKQYAPVIKGLLAAALKDERKQRNGYKRNKQKQVLDTKGNLFADTWNKGGEIAYEYKTTYGGIFREVKAEPVKTDNPE